MVTDNLFEKYSLATGGLVVIYIDTFELEVGVSAVRSSGVDSVLIRDNFPELKQISIHVVECKQKNRLSRNWGKTEVIRTRGGFLWEITSKPQFWGLKSLFY